MLRSQTRRVTGKLELQPYLRVLHASCWVSMCLCIRASQRSPMEKQQLMICVHVSSHTSLTQQEGL